MQNKPLFIAGICAGSIGLVMTGLFIADIIVTKQLSKKAKKIEFENGKNIGTLNIEKVDNRVSNLYLAIKDEATLNALYQNQNVTVTVKILESDLTQKNHLA